ncbi:MAG: chloride channel protein, partial [Limosilactobacillus sp.]|nr:chloride channel protein [Limosilactobacillus sp.]
MQKLKWPLVGAGMVIGILAGVVAASLSLFLDGVEHVMLHYHETNLHPIATGTNPWWRLLSVTLAGIISAISWYYLQRQRKLVNINQALKQQVMPVKATTLAALTHISSVGSG